MTEKDLIEILADIEHTRWAKWQIYLHSKCFCQDDGRLSIPADLVKRWEKQICTPYSKLSEAEKESDRKEVMGYLQLIKVFYSANAIDDSAEAIRQIAG